MSTLLVLWLRSRGAEDGTPESTPLVGTQPMEVLTQGTVTDPVLGAQR